MGLLITFHVQEFYDKMVLLSIKKRILEEFTKTMISEIRFPKYF